MTELKSYTGSLLVAAPDLVDPYFARSVVVIVEHSEEGAFGLILNKELEVRLDEVAGSLDLEWGGSTPAPSALMGGPVMPESVWLLAGEVPEDADTRTVVPGVVVTTDADAIRAALSSPVTRQRLLLGYSGWSPQQLDREVAEGGWLLLPARADAVLGRAPGTAWEQALRDLGIPVGAYTPTLTDTGDGPRYLN